MPVHLARSGHSFHSQCVARWFQSTQFQARSCPHCRQNPLVSDLEYADVEVERQLAQEGRGVGVDASTTARRQAAEPEEPPFVTPEQCDACLDWLGRLLPVYLTSFAAPIATAPSSSVMSAPVLRAGGTLTRTGAGYHSLFSAV